MKVMSITDDRSLKKLETELRRTGSAFISTKGADGRALGDFVERHLPEMERLEQEAEPGFVGNLTISTELKRDLHITDDVYTAKSVAFGGAAGLGTSMIWLGIKNLAGRPEVAVPVAIGGILAGMAVWPTLRQLLPGATVTPDKEGFKIELGKPTETVKHSVTYSKKKAPAPKAPKTKKAAKMSEASPTPLPSGTTVGGLAPGFPSLVGTGHLGGLPGCYVSSLVGSTPFLAVAALQKEVADMKAEIATLSDDLRHMRRKLAEAADDGRGTH